MKLFAKILTAAVISAGALAHAAEVTFTGMANGTFGAVNATQSSSFQGLSYVGSTINGTTSGGMLGLGGDPASTMTANTNNLGSFTLNTTAYTSYSTPFTLKVTFTAPTGIVGGPTSTFSALVSGAVTGQNNGGVFINFGANGTQAFTFSNSGQTGSFTLFVNNLSINPGSVASLTGTIMANGVNASATPEPSSLMLLGTGLLSAAGVAIRKRSLV